MAIDWMKEIDTFNQVYGLGNQIGAQFALKDLQSSGPMGLAADASELERRKAMSLARGDIYERFGMQDRAIEARDRAAALGLQDLQFQTAKLQLDDMIRKDNMAQALEGLDQQITSIYGGDDAAWTQFIDDNYETITLAGDAPVKMSRGKDGKLMMEFDIDGDGKVDKFEYANAAAIDQDTRRLLTEAMSPYARARIDPSYMEVIREENYRDKMLAIEEIKANAARERAANAGKSPAWQAQLRADALNTLRGSKGVVNFQEWLAAWSYANDANPADMDSEALFTEYQNWANLLAQNTAAPKADPNAGRGDAPSAATGLSILPKSGDPLVGFMTDVIESGAALFGLDETPPTDKPAFNPKLPAGSGRSSLNRKAGG